MTFSTRLIILAVTKTGEKTLVVHTISDLWGRRSFVTSVPKHGTMALYMPMSVVDAEIVDNPRSELWRLRNAVAIHTLDSVRSSVEKNSITLFMSEVLFRTIKDGAIEDGLFDWCEKIMVTLENLGDNYSNFPLRFLLELCYTLGFAPSAEGLMPFAGEYLETLKTLIAEDFAAFMTHPLNGKARNDMAAVVIDYLSYHTESRIEVKSLKVLRELFAV